MFFGLTPLGTFHTAISLMAVIAGFVALARYKEISTRRTAGLFFFWGTVSLFLHFIPATVETLTGFPAAAPFLSSPEDPKAQPIIGVFFLVRTVKSTEQWSTSALIPFSE